MSEVASGPLLELRHVSKTYVVKPMFGVARRVEALRDVSLTLTAGKALVIVGESGSGKSTIGRAVARLFALSAGQILFEGRDIAGFTTAQAAMDYRRVVQMVFQDPFAALNPAHTVRHHLQRPLQLHRGLTGKALDAATKLTLAEVELDPDRTIEKYPHELSGGQRQRVNLARALAVGAKLIVADEPTSMLDVSIRRSVLDLMGRLKRERGIAFLYITHDIATARYIAEDTAVMFGGQVVEWGPSADIIGNPGHAYTKVLLSAVPDPAVRLVGSLGRLDEFARGVAAARQSSQLPGGPGVEMTPGHFVRHMS